MLKATFRFYEELNDYLPEEVRKADLTHSFAPPASIQHAITSLHIPCEEIDLILVNGLPVDFSYLLKNNDRVSVYPGNGNRIHDGTIITTLSIEKERYE
jgi:hypothetical protein